MKTFIVLCFTLCLVGRSKGKSTAVLSVTSFSAATFVKSSGATLNMVSPSGTIDIPLSSVTTRTLNVGSYTAVSFTSVAMHSVSHFVKTPRVTTALTSITETGVQPTFASTVKPTLTSSANVAGCKNYTVLSEADRAQGHIVINASNYRCDRDDLVSGWYRFQGAAGDRMADECVPAYHCGTQYPGWLNGKHPTVSEGVVTRRVCYNYKYHHWYSSSYCCLWSNNIRVRNCGAFFVYELQNPPHCYLRYCGNGTAVDGCNNYTVLSEADRAQGHIVINASNYRCDRDDLVPGWYRFQGAAGDRIADKCVPEDHCGTRYPGWLDGTHPTVSEGVVTRRVCFPNNYRYKYRYWSWYWYWSNCCLLSKIIRVKNCGAFFVYELQKPSYCNVRYCGNGTTVDGCNNYTVLSEADRAQGNIVINASNYRCDRDDLVPGWYRFQGAAGDRMADKCVPLNHCGSQYPGWLNGTHPESSEGVVSRRVCYPSKFYYGYWYPSSNCCISSNIIRVKNCGAYFVYELQKPPHCNFSYCGNGSAAYTCPALTVPSNGIKFGCPSENAPMYNDTVCQFSCNDGYIGSGSQARRCQNNGTWSGQDFTCQIDDTCPALRLPTNSKLLGCSTTEMLYGTVCKFSCKEGSEGKGSTVRKCTKNGSWSGADLVCIDICGAVEAHETSVSRRTLLRQTRLNPRSNECNTL